MPRIENSVEQAPFACRDINDDGLSLQTKVGEVDDEKLKSCRLS
jgi:hypothetical protein